MNDLKMKFVNDVVYGLSEYFTADQLKTIENSVVKSLGAYDVVEKCTQLVLYDDSNHKIIKRYRACMFIDGKSEKTINLYCRQLQRFHEKVGKSFAEVGTYDIKMYLGMMKEEGVSNRTLENYRSYLSAFFQWMTNEELISKNPCSRVASIKYKDEVRYPFSMMDIDRIHSKCSTIRDRAIVDLLYSSGLRSNELCSLDINDLNFNDNSIHVRNGKGGKERVCYFSDIAAMHLKSYLDTRQDEKTELFLSKRNTRLTTSGLKDILKRIEKASGVTNIHPHRFRRTFATNMHKRGMDVQTIRKLMGHSNVQTTMTYIYIDDSQVNEAYRDCAC